MKSSKIKISVLLISVFGLSALMHSQTSIPMASISTDLPEVTPASPTVASLMKFEEIPVSHYTGVPDISVPLYSVKSLSNHIAIDLQLKYHPASIAVKEMAGYTGLGWSLTSGGSISRTVRGIPDEICQVGGVSGLNRSRIGIYHNNLNSFHVNKYYEVLDLIGTAMNPSQMETVSQYMWYAFEKGILDSEHDLYQFNFMGYSGRFYVKMNSPGNLEVVKLDNDNSLEIELNYSYSGQPTYSYIFEGFTVYDDHGYKYVFDVKEITSETNVSESQSFKTIESPQTTFDMQLNYVSSFHLSKIYDNNNQLLVDFSYQDSSEIITESSLVSYYIQPPQLQSQIEHWLNFNNYSINGLLPHTSISSKTRNILTKKIQQIDVVGKSKIEFELLQGREDSRLNSTAHRLGTIIIKDAYNVPLKKFDFTYDYSTLYYSALVNKRLVLNSVVEKNFSDSRELGYHFHYKFKNLPFSNGKYDYWGYYKNSGSNRETDPVYCVAGVLEKMTLPTGGHISFDFESNTYSHIGNDALSNFEDNPNNWDYYSQNYQLSNSGGTVQQALGTSSLPRIVQFNYTITPEVGEGLVSIVNSSGQIPQMIHPSQYLLEPNVSYFVQFVWMDIQQSGQLSIQLDFKTPSAIQESFLYGGGIRIKSVGFYENENSTIPSKLKNYSYQFFTNSLSSGALVFPKPLFAYERSAKTYSTQVSLGSVNYKVIADFNNLLAVKTKGADIGYKNVTVTEGSTLPTNGYSQYTFYSPIDYPESYYTVQYPFLPSWNFDYRRGHLTNEKHFRNLDAFNSQIISESDYVYEWEDNESSIRTGIRGLILDGCPMSSTFDHYDAFVSCYNNSACSMGWSGDCVLSAYLSFANIIEAFGWPKLIQKTSKEFFYENNSSNTVIKDEYYSYNTVNKKVSSYSTQSSLNELLLTHFQYDQNHDNRNRIGVIKTIEQWRDGIKTGTKEVNYINQFSGNTSFLPSTINTSKNTNNLESKVRYVQYDHNSNPLEVKQENGSSISYIWGYNHSFPVAKIENISYQQIPSNLIADIHSAATQVQYNQQTLETALENLRNHTALSNAMITTYTYYPGVGLRSVKDPKGYESKFYYDSFWRLEYVKEVIENSMGQPVENTLSAYEYYYRTQD